ncbi:dTDP-4-dehydrorhamnose reductase [Alkalidesulfovibrio alkalitolerans DSM 16529]|uniref:dTDP-4-dehydrorhamnose reductase n=1 Tax=Alkalidesulfovibrio alkalitolerans DSM 16529 TaxID=1121439 RepID=S7TD55_9BACT|nr:dTDP-4-dehydrorhamnose reductase [Alkalidesulfovibrio alkalitolerans]EPR34591.1 dTDP-4-dehydrorhamnose reductase [Alkalidesulfovibrio alkalitolerans DSM 16529]
MSAARVALVLGGRHGLLGQALTKALPLAGWRAVALGREDFDPFDQGALRETCQREQATAIFNTVAYTAVDQAEDDRDAAFRLNRNLPRLLGLSARELGIALVHFSTDFVFDGKKDTPYTAKDNPAPESVYGQSKLAGEQALLEIAPPDLLIIRTSWLFGPGKANFVSKILDLAHTRDKLTVVADQTGSPTYTPDLAKNSVVLLDSGARGLFHLASGGKATWCELAAQAVHLAGYPCRVEPIATDAWPAKAKRPRFSVLDLDAFTEATGIVPRPWEQGLRDYIFTDLALGDALGED